MISVAMATYNGEKYILEQLESIRSQTIQVNEVIINDDCSTDQTVKLISDFILANNLMHWKVFINKTNLGFSKNFYEAVNKTNGDIIFLADQDDVWLSNKVDITQQVFKNNKNLKVLSSGQIFIDAKGRSINNNVNGITIENQKMNLRYLPFDFFIGNSVIPGCTMCISKEIKQFLLDFGAPDLSKSFGHDWYFSIVGAALGNFGSINNVLLKRRIHNNNASKASLRKTTVLASKVEKRNKYLEQIIEAHQFILTNEVFEKNLTKQDIKKTKQMLGFFKKRLEFKTTKIFFIWISLGFNFLKYYQCAKSFKGGIKLYAADLFYAYNINWKIQNKNIVK